MSRTEHPSSPSPASSACGVHAARLNLADYAHNFSDSQTPLTAAQAAIEAERCYYCFDAPCITACPTGIDVPSFIQRIAQGNLRGAAKTILSANPLGGMCARVCPTEVLCEQACVRNTHEDKPVEIGALQRHATDALFESAKAPPLFARQAPTGKRVAVVGAGPAGLAAAHGLALQGHEVVLFDAQDKPGGLNEFGIAAYKTTHNFAQREVHWLLSIGGIDLRLNCALGRDISLAELRAGFDAVFLGLGLASVPALGLPEPAGLDLRANQAAVDFIEQVRRAQAANDLARVPVGRHVVVIGGGMTAIDAAVQAKLLGAETATIVYRRGPVSMPASQHERDWAQTQGVLIRHWAAPKAIHAEAGQLTGIEFATTFLQDGRLVHGAETFILPADMLLRAIGQSHDTGPAGTELRLQEGRIHTDAKGQTNLPRVWAGGDCRYGGRDLTVAAVEQGKVAAAAMHAALMS